MYSGMLEEIGDSGGLMAGGCRACAALCYGAVALCSLLRLLKLARMLAICLLLFAWLRHCAADGPLLAVS